MGVQTVISAFWRLVRFHLGTAAFGSFIIALIQLVRIILAYIEHLVKKYEVRIRRFLKNSIRIEYFTEKRIWYGRKSGSGYFESCPGLPPVHLGLF